MLFLGGHGKSIAGRYYYYPQSIDFSAGHTVEKQGIGQDKWQAWLGSISAQKTLLVLDTCESNSAAGLVRGADSARQTAMDQLQYATGHNLIAAASQAAYEGYRGHGILTYALLEALDQKVDNGTDDRVKVGVLANHVDERVPQISQQLLGIVQRPIRKLSGNDFPIGIRRPVLGTAGDRPTILTTPTHVLVRSELVREGTAPDAPVGRTLAPGTQVRAVEFVGTWVVIARDGEKLGYVSADALARLQ